MTTRILIENVGEFHLQPELVPSLIGWLNSNQAVKGQKPDDNIKEIINIQFPGKELING
jgi:hypothetical protein